VIRLLRRFLRCWKKQPMSMESLRRKASARVRQKTEGKIQGGPFTGVLWSSQRGAWGEFDEASILLGFYESELHPVIEEIIEQAPELLINVGCADGYYAIGFASRLPETRVLAVDIDETALVLTEENARINGVRVEVQTALPAMSLADAVLVVDVEGAEREILLDNPNYDFSEAKILVELHPWIDPEVREDLLSKYSLSHDVESIVSGGRNPNSSEILREMSDDLKWAVMAEGRPRAMEWLWMVHKKL